jgi:hypothetical protein
LLHCYCTPVNQKETQIILNVCMSAHAAKCTGERVLAASSQCRTGYAPGLALFAGERAMAFSKKELKKLVLVVQVTKEVANDRVLEAAARQMAAAQTAVPH